MVKCRATLHSKLRLTNATTNKQFELNLFEGQIGYVYTELRDAVIK